MQRFAVTLKHKEKPDIKTVYLCLAETADEAVAKALTAVLFEPDVMSLDYTATVVTRQ